MKPLRIFKGIVRPRRIMKGLIRPLRIFQGPKRPLRILKGIIRPLRILKGLMRPPIIFKLLENLWESLRVVWESKLRDKEWSDNSPQLERDGPLRPKIDRQKDQTVPDSWGQMAPWGHTLAYRERPENPWQLEPDGPLRPELDRQRTTSQSPTAEVRWSPEARNWQTEKTKICSDNWSSSLFYFPGFSKFFIFSLFFVVSGFSRQPPPQTAPQ